MAGGFPIMRAYRPASSPETVDSDPMPSTAVSHPAPQNTDSQRLCWIQTGVTWSRILAQTVEHCRKYQLEVNRAQKKVRPVQFPPTTLFRPAPLNTKARRAVWIQEAKAWSRDLTDKIERRKRHAAQAKAKAEIKTQVAELVSYKLIWSTSCAGLVISAVLFLILSIDVLRDTQGGQLGVNTTCGVVPSLTDGSVFSVVYWIAVALYFFARLAAPLAAENVAGLSKVLGRCADAAYYRRQSQHRVVVLVAIEALSMGFVSMVLGEIRGAGDACLRVALAMPMFMNWSFLGSIGSVLVLESGYGSLVGLWKRITSMLSLKKERRETVGKRVWELLSQDEKKKLEWV